MKKRQIRLTRLEPSVQESIIADTLSLLPELASRIGYMYVYEMVKWRNTNKEPFSIDNTDRAVGYAIRKVRGKYVVSPYCWIIRNDDLLLGESVGYKEPGTIYVGVRVSDEMQYKYRNHANNHILNSLSAIKACSTPRA